MTHDPQTQAAVLYVLAGCFVFAACVGLLYCVLVGVFAYVNYQRGMSLGDAFRRALEELQ